MKKGILFLTIVFFCQTISSQETAEYYLDFGNSKLFVKEMGEGPALVFLHGGPADNHLSFMPYAKELAKHFRVILYDQNDAGKSTSKIQEPHTAEREAETLEFLRKKLNLEKLSLVGHSWGTILSLFYAEKYPDKIHKITLISSIGTSFQYYMTFAQNLQKKFTQDDLKKIQALSSKPNVQPSDYLEIYLPYYFYDSNNIERLTKTNINFAVNREILGDISQKFDLRGKESTYNFPILVLQGESDMLNVSDMKQAFSNFPNVRIHEIKKAGHFPFVENPAEVSTQLKMFFK